MEKLKQCLRKMFFPHVLIKIFLLIFSTAFLVYAMTALGTENVFSYVSYVLSAYTLTIWCIEIPSAVKYLKKFKSENKIAQMWLCDVRLRVNVMLFLSFVWNIAYAVFQLCIGVYHSSVWYYSTAIYYFLLAFMRIYLSSHTRRYNPGDKMRAELIRYRVCGVVFLVMNLALSVMVFLMIYENRSFNHHEITTIAMAAYTFSTFVFAIVNIIKYRKYNSPVYSASKAISLTAACVSMITLTSTMLTTFGEFEDLLFRRIMLASLGGTVSIFIITMSLYMIVRSNKLLKEFCRVNIK